jgi:uncharacterized PurR-regulated membrane protein YhhQ (DUF165 family)
MLAVYVGLYLFAAIAANLIIAAFGPLAVFVVAFLLIGLDLTVRDKLHEAWHRNGLVWKMVVLVGIGSALSWALNRNAGPVALASFAAFLSAGLVDALVYQKLFSRRWLVKVNGSNVFSAAADSLVFPTIAFGALMPTIVIGQFLAKVLGGFIWSLVLRWWRSDTKVAQSVQNA